MVTGGDVAAGGAANESNRSNRERLARYLRPFISLCHCDVESKRGRIPRAKHWKTTLAVLAALSASLALAEDFRTINRKEYKDAEISR